MHVMEGGRSRKKRTITRLATFKVVDAELDAPTVYSLFKCPRRKRAIIDHVKIHSNAGSLAGADDINFGGGAAAATPVWLDAGDISSMTTAQMELKLVPAGATVIIDGDDATVANRTFGAEVVSGATTTTTYWIDVWGYLLNS